VYPVAVNKLTAKQEKFCQSIADGMNQTEAYKSAYSCKHMSEKALWVEAGRIADNPKVSLRISELKAQIAKKRLWTRELSVNILGSIATNRGAKDGDRIAAVKELNNMHGFSTALDLEDYVMPVRIVREVVDGSKVSINNPPG